MCSCVREKKNKNSSDAEKTKFCLAIQKHFRNPHPFKLTMSTDLCKVNTSKSPSTHPPPSPLPTHTHTCLHLTGYQAQSATPTLRLQFCPQVTGEQPFRHQCSLQEHNAICCLTSSCGSPEGIVLPLQLCRTEGEGGGREVRRWREERDGESVINEIKTAAAT